MKASTAYIHQSVAALTEKVEQMKIDHYKLAKKHGNTKAQLQTMKAKLKASEEEVHILKQKVADKGIKVDSRNRVPKLPVWQGNYERRCQGKEVDKDPPTPAVARAKLEKKMHILQGRRRGTG